MGDDSKQGLVMAGEARPGEAWHGGARQGRRGLARHGRAWQGKAGMGLKFLIKPKEDISCPKKIKQ